MPGWWPEIEHPKTSSPSARPSCYTEDPDQAPTRQRVKKIHDQPSLSDNESPASGGSRINLRGGSSFFFLHFSPFPSLLCLKIVAGFLELLCARGGRGAGAPLAPPLDPPLAARPAREQINSVGSDKTDPGTFASGREGCACVLCTKKMRKRTLQVFDMPYSSRDYCFRHLHIFFLNGKK